MMPQIVIDGTQLVVSRLAFGTGSIHRAGSRRAIGRLIAGAIEEGFTHFDTSPYYGFGIAEDVLGEVLCGARETCTVATKVGLYPPGGRAGSRVVVTARKAIGRLVRCLSRAEIDWSVARANRSLNKSLGTLRRERVDVLFLHEPEYALLSADELLAWLERARADGRVRYWGIAACFERCLPFVAAQHPLSAIVQTNDSMELREARQVEQLGRALQFTYGYLSALRRSERRRSADQVLRAALEANSTGAVIVSTSRADRVSKLSKIAQKERAR
jgi:aryl-alcohol dehydrogenase-like predicted oxidoreductase